MRNTLSVVGFSIFLLGFIAIVLSLVGLNLKPLLFLNNFGTLPSFVIKIMMVLGGMMIFYIGRTGLLEEDEE